MRGSAHGDRQFVSELAIDSKRAWSLQLPDEPLLHGATRAFVTTARHTGPLGPRLVMLSINRALRLSIPYEHRGAITSGGRGKPKWGPSPSLKYGSQQPS